MRRRFIRYLKGQSGAFDLPSIITGVVVVGILAAGVLAAIFGVIPWSQDNGAKQDLSTVNTAEGVAYAKDGQQYADLAGLTGKSLIGGANPDRLEVTTGNGGQAFTAIADAGNGNRWYITHDNPKPRLWTGEGDGEPTAPAVTYAALASWGENYSGALGNGTGNDAHSRVPVSVDMSAFGSKTIKNVSAGEYHACAITSDDLAYCWGANWEGEIGDGTYTDAVRAVPVDMSGILAGKTILQVSAGEQHTCVIASDHKAYCWGEGANGELGNGDPADQLRPVAVDTSGVLAGKVLTQITAGKDHNCVVDSEAKAYCWGDAGPYSSGATGNGSLSGSMTPVAVNLPGQVTLISASEYAGDNFVCALADATVYCWGSNGYGNFGNGTTGGVSALPVAVDMSGVLSGKEITSLATGATGVCVLADGAPYCWGKSNYVTAFGTTPTAISTSGALAGKAITDLSVGSFHACVVADGAPYCWGNDYDGALGIGGTDDDFVTLDPMAVKTDGVLSGQTVASVHAGSYYTVVMLK